MVADCTKFKTKTLGGHFVFLVFLFFLTNTINKMNETCLVKKKSTKLYAKPFLFKNQQQKQFFFGVY